MTELLVLAGILTGIMLGLPIGIIAASIYRIISKLTNRNLPDKLSPNTSIERR